MRATVAVTAAIFVLTLTVLMSEHFACTAYERVTIGAKIAIGDRCK